MHIVMKKRLIILSGLFLLLLALYFFNPHDYFQLTYIQHELNAFKHYRALYPVQIGLIFFIVYLCLTGLSLPVTTLMTLLSGALFGLYWGELIASFASALGACLALLSARFLFREQIERRYPEKLNKINQGIKKEGNAYLFALRLSPLIPYFIVNLVVGVTAFRLATFYWVSQLGMLPETVIYVSAGSQLAQLTSLQDVLSPTLIISLSFIGIFPLIAKRLVAR